MGRRKPSEAVASGGCQWSANRRSIRLGRRWFSLHSLPEQDEIGRRLDDCDVFIYSYLPGFRATLAAAVAALLPLRNAWSVRLLRGALRRNSLPVGGFVVGRVLGHSQGRRITLTAQVIYDKHRDYSLAVSGVTAD